MRSRLAFRLLERLLIRDLLFVVRRLGAFLLRLSKKVDDLLKNFQPTLAAEGEKAFDEVGSEDKISRFVDAMAEDLVKHKGAGVVAVGSHQPLDVQLLALKLTKSSRTSASRCC